MKTEPDTFSIDDLARKDVEAWDGVRNYQARNFMRDQMRPGDRVLFYHSSTTPPGIAGIAEVRSTAYPDPSQFDPSSPYFDPKSTPDAPRWVVVDIAFVRTFPRLVTLDELRANPKTAGMQVCRRGNRLSITPVTTEEYEAALQLA